MFNQVSPPLISRRPRIVPCLWTPSPSRLLGSTTSLLLLSKSYQAVISKSSVIWALPRAGTQLKLCLAPNEGHKKKTLGNLSRFTSCLVFSFRFLYLLPLSVNFFMVLIIQRPFFAWRAFLFASSCFWMRQSQPLIDQLSQLQMTSLQLVWRKVLQNLLSSQRRWRVCLTVTVAVEFTLGLTLLPHQAFNTSVLQLTRAVFQTVPELLLQYHCLEYYCVTSISVCDAVKTQRSEN